MSSSVVVLRSSFFEPFNEQELKRKQINTKPKTTYFMAFLSANN